MSSVVAIPSLTPLKRPREAVRKSSARTVNKAVAEEQPLPWFYRRWTIALVGSTVLHLNLLLILALWLMPGRSNSPPPEIDSTLGIAEGHEFDFEKIDVEPADMEEAAPQASAASLIHSTDVNAVNSASNHFGRHRDGVGEALHPGVGGKGGGVTFFGTEAIGDSFVFVLDRSGSMRGHRWDIVRHETIRAIDQMTLEQTVFVFLYHNTAVPMPTVHRERNRLAPATDRIQARIRGWLNRQRAGGGTFPETAMQLALDMKPDVIFFLTDGQFRRSIRTMVQEQNEHGTVIHTIAVGNRQSEPLLKGIAEDHNGRYRFVE